MLTKQYTLDGMTKSERSLLLYIESVSVDYAGLVHNQRINADDRIILKRWHDEGFIFFSRIQWDSIQTLHDKHNTDLVRLSETAWKLAHEERRARAIRMMSKEPYCSLKTTHTLNAEWKEA